MKKILFITSLFFGLVSFGQDNQSGVSKGQAPLQKGQTQFNVGAGFGNGFPVFASYDIAIHNDITVAPEIGLNLNGFDYLTIAGRGDYHFNRIIGIPSNWDFYAGINIGFVLGFSDYNGNEGLDLGAQVGGRYYFSDKFGVMIEGGGGRINYGGKIGLTIKM